MGRTVTEKILAAHCKQRNFKPGDIIDVDVDLLLMNDITGPVAVEVFNKMGDGDVFDKNKIVVVLDHFTPNKDVTSAKLSKTVLYSVTSIIKMTYPFFCNEIAHGL